MTDSVERAILRVPVDHPAYAGHFPGNPIAPGAWLLAQAIRLFDVNGIEAFAWRELAAAKFLKPVRPGAILDVRLHRHSGGCALEVLEGGQAVCSARFKA